MPDADRSPMDVVMPRLWQTDPKAEPILALEIIAGPYKGAIFAFTSFDLMPHRLDNGMVATKFETTVFQKPENFREDEAWDEFCAELVLAWLSYVATHDFRPLIASRPVGGIH